jgi:hypothetical protein
MIRVFVRHDDGPYDLGTHPHGPQALAERAKAEPGVDEKRVAAGGDDDGVSPAPATEDGEVHWSTACA